MPIRSYNTFYPGIKEDDFLTGGANFIEGNNVTALKTGYGMSLGPKVNKQLLTSTTAPRTIFGVERSDLVLDDIAVGCDTGAIYKLTSTDNTPIYNLTTNPTYNILNGFSHGIYYYFISKNPSVSSTACDIAQVFRSDFQNETFASMNESFLSFNNLYTPPVLKTSTFAYVGGLSNVHQISTAGAIVTFSIFNSYVTGITKHGTQFMVYTNASSGGEVAYWDGVSSSVTANIPLGFRPARVESDGGVDHIIADDGDYWVGSGYSFTNITKKRQSNRLKDNSGYKTKFDFTPDFITGQPMSFARGGLFMIANEDSPGIYRKEELIAGLPEGFNKSITRDNTNVVFDEVFTTKYISRGQSKLFFGFQSGTTTFGVDYIDLNSEESAKDGYAVTEVFSGGTARQKQIMLMNIARSYASGNDYIKLYKRINNAASWTEIALPTLTDDIIKRDQINSEVDEFVDTQFMLEFHNEAQDSNPPLLGELELNYDDNLEK